MRGSLSVLAPAAAGLALLCTALLGAEQFRSIAASRTATTAPSGSPPTLGNYPDTSIQLSINTTVIPDAPPTNTTSINVSISTDFTGTLEGNPDTGVIRITNPHPAGVYLVTIRALNGGSSVASKSFTLTVTTPPTCSPVTFASPTTFPAGTFTASVAVGDFNGDGKQDLAVGNNTGVATLTGNGSGGFSAPTNFNTGSSPYHYGIAVGDFNGDGKQDLVVANYYGATVSILLGDGTGSFSSPTDFFVGTNPASVAVGDFNGDFKQDLAVGKPGSSIAILFGDGAGNFSAPSNVDAGGNAAKIALGDFNRDGKPDIAVTNYQNSVSILLGRAVVISARQQVSLLAMLLFG